MVMDFQSFYQSDCLIFDSMLEYSIDLNCLYSLEGCCRKSFHSCLTLMNAFSAVVLVLISGSVLAVAFLNYLEVDVIRLIILILVPRYY